MVGTEIDEDFLPLNERIERLGVRSANGAGVGRWMAVFVKGCVWMVGGWLGRKGSDVEDDAVGVQE